VVHGQAQRGARGTPPIAGLEIPRVHPLAGLDRLGVPVREQRDLAEKLERGDVELAARGLTAMSSSQAAA
jgi:hypothetical protein